ncbi:hypothetical protein CBS101457_001621 [Exobasidium rhododendri]|nr:hypothetical protein CBS101457_001621 [Exobasidium rhododendri]
MTRSEVAPTSRAEYEQDKHSHGLPGGRAGPNKDGATAPDGASALGNEIGAEGDARRERAKAIQEGDTLPPLDQSNDGTAGSLGFGQQSGYEKGMGDNPSHAEREGMQGDKNEEWQSGKPDLASIAKSSGGSAAYNPTSDPDSVVSSANETPSQMLNQVGRSEGTESGYGA